MTVEQLIEELKKVPPHWEVHKAWRDYTDCDWVDEYGSIYEVITIDTFEYVILD